MIQVRSEETGIQEFETITHAMAEAVRDPTIWKISFNAENGERARLVRSQSFDCGERWVWEPILSESDR